MSRIKRNGHLVRSRVQRAVLLRFLLHWFAFAASFCGVAFCLHVFLSEPGETAPLLLKQMWQRYALLAVVALTLVPYFLYDLLKLTHRFAGPMVRFGNALHRAAQGETVAPIKFRDGDYWQELAIDFNAVMARIPRDEEDPLELALAALKNDVEAEDTAELVST